jgi:hypothetical protein
MRVKEELKIICFMEREGKCWVVHGRMEPGGAFFTEAKSLRKVFKHLLDIARLAREEKS